MWIRCIRFAEVWGDDAGFSPFVNHTWWEQQAFAQELLGDNHRYVAQTSYETTMKEGTTPSEFSSSLHIVCTVSCHTANVLNQSIVVR